MVLSIEESWEEATNGFDKDVCHAWFLRLQEVYSEDKRKYHNLDSLRDKLSHYNDIKNQLKNPKALLLALLFQKYIITTLVISLNNSLTVIIDANFL